MTRSIIAGVTVCGAALAAVLVASPVAAQTTPVSISLAAVVGARPFSCTESYEGIGTTDSTVRMTDFRFYVSNVRLTKADGSAVPLTLKQDGFWELDDAVSYTHLTPAASGLGEISGGAGSFKKKHMIQYVAESEATETQKRG